MFATFCKSVFGKFQLVVWFGFGFGVLGGFIVFYFDFVFFLLLFSVVFFLFVCLFFWYFF